MMIFIYQNILVGILFLMKLIYSDDEISEKENVKIATSSGSPVEWIEEESYFF